MATNPEPLTVVAGDTVRWRKTISSFKVDDKLEIKPISESWTLKYYLRGGAAVIDITATVDGDDYLVNVAAATTKNWAVGAYSWQAFLSKGADRYRVDSGQITVTANLETATSFENRSHAKIVLDNVKAVLEQRASSEILSYSINGRSLDKHSLADLLQLRDRAQQWYDNELAAERAANGLGTGRNIYVRFG